MYIIKPQNIAAYTRCPRKAHHLWKQKPPSTVVSQVISKIIQVAYSHHAKTNEAPLWRRFPPWLDLHVPIEWRALEGAERYSQGLDLLVRLSSWYNNYYVDSAAPGLVNFPVSKPVGEYFSFSDTIPIVEIGSKVKLLDIVEGDSNVSGRSLYNDFAIQARIWGFYMFSDIMPDEYVQLVIQPKSIRPVSINITEKALEKTGKMVNHIVHSIMKGMYYPSFSEQCQKCPYAARCSI